MTGLLDKRAPLQKKTITVRPRVPWFKNEIKEAMCLRRRYERIWRRTGLESDRVNFIKARNHTNHIIEQARRDYYFNLINENDCDQRKLFKTASALLGGSSQEKYPKHSDPTLLVNDFGRFFIQKIDVICSKLDRIDSSLNHPHHSIGSSIQESSFAGTPFNNFQPISSEGIKKLVLNAPNKIVKDCINELLPTISNMANLSLSSGHFPDIWKEGLVRPKLKNANMDLIKKNYRPVSNLAFLSKITEKAAALQISDHVSSNQMFPEFQSAYRKNRSTETALLRMRNDILVNMNKQQVTLLVFLDLSAAFDTVDHDILLQRLEYKFGIKDQAVTWFKSYLSNRSQRIVIGSTKSDSFDLKFGVPQGSYIGPMLFSLYTSELFDVISQHLPTAHSYADDTGIYLAFNPNDDSNQDAAIAAMEACLCDIRNWMINDKLMISDSKTEFMLIGTKAQLQKTKRATLTIGESIISPNTEPLRNLGAWFDCNFEW